MKNSYGPDKVLPEQVRTAPDDKFIHVIDWQLKIIEDVIQERATALLREEEENKAKIEREKRAKERPPKAPKNKSGDKKSSNNAETNPTEVKSEPEGKAEGKSEGKPESKGSVTPPESSEEKEKIPNEVGKSVPRVEDEIVMRVGRIGISRKRLGIGSHGTNVFVGVYDGEPCAVKVLMSSHWQTQGQTFGHEVKMMQDIYRKSPSGYPNVLVRIFGTEEQEDVLSGGRKLIALELCDQTLGDFVRSGGFKNNPELKRKAIRNIIDAVAFLHQPQINIVHNDLNPNNVLVKGNNFKVSDFGLSKQLAATNGSFTFTHVLNTGNDGFRAHEVVLGKRKSNKVDIFSLGMLCYYILSDGELPFGSANESAGNAISNWRKPDLFKVSERGAHLLSAMLEHDPDKRCNIQYVLSHPFLWSDDRCLLVLSTLSNTLTGSEAKQGEAEKELVRVLGRGERSLPWSKVVDVSLWQYLTAIRGYDNRKFNDLLRGVRNLYTHWTEIEDENVRGLFDNKPTGLITYIESKYPLFIVACWEAMIKLGIEVPVIAF